MKKLSLINETLWAGQVRRSSGKITRKEDDVDLMSPEEFSEYTKKKYEKSILNLDYGNHVLVILKDNKKTFVGAIYFKDEKNRDIDHPGNFWCEFHDSVIKYERILMDNYVIDFCNKDSIAGENIAKVSPKGGVELTNKECLKILDIIVNNI